ncbi:MAG: enoyl-CoA hydratase/isomerase family protein [Deltaproteobacteria bacterium]|jgi:2-(1,2-epoxy-1,2-dihydrophenyl)acetyl-CoA isomerase|nr:enoyl-CoA hydratase/isomerase family protein [Deltaproteobacteria bacterium]
MSELIKVRQHDNCVEIALNRPEAYNAFNLEMVTQLTDALMGAATNDNTRGIVIAGRGKAFCAGGDLKYALDFPEGAPAGFHRLAGQFHLAVTEIRRMPKPVVAAIHGAAAGGGFSMALACDFRVMEKTARMIQAYTSNGLCIDGGGTFTLPRIVGLTRALEIAAFDEPISADQALDWGMATKVVEDGQAFEEALSLVQKLSQRSVNSFGWTKKLFTDSFSSTFESQIERERVGMCACAQHPDGKEGLIAFSEKRKPVFGDG